MGYQITCKYLQIGTKSHEKPTPVNPVEGRENGASGLTPPSTMGQDEEREELRSPKPGVLRHPLEQHTLDKALEKMEGGSKPVWQFLSCVLFPRVKILLPLS